MIFVCMRTDVNESHKSPSKQMGTADTCSQVVVSMGKDMLHICQVICDIGAKTPENTNLDSSIGGRMEWKGNSQLKQDTELRQLP